MLRAKRETWQRQEKAKSDQVLYKLLGHCLELVYAVQEDTSITDGIDAILKNLGITVTAATSLELKVVRLIFGEKNSSKNTSASEMTYRAVIAQASDNAIAPDDLPTFIANRGGIDEMRRHGGKSAGKDKADRNTQIAIATSELRDLSASAVAKNVELPEPVKPQKGKDFVAGHPQEPFGYAASCDDQTLHGGVSRVLAARFC